MYTQKVRTLLVPAVPNYATARRTSCQGFSSAWYYPMVDVTTLGHSPPESHQTIG